MSTLEASPHRVGPASPFLAPPILQKILGSTPLLLLATAAAYFIAAKIGIAASIGPHGIAIVWPGNAIVLFILLSIARLAFVANLKAQPHAVVNSEQRPERVGEVSRVTLR